MSDLTRADIDAVLDAQRGLYLGYAAVTTTEDIIRQLLDTLERVHRINTEVISTADWKDLDETITRLVVKSDPPDPREWWHNGQGVIKTTVSRRTVLVLETEAHAQAVVDAHNRSLRETP